MHYYSPLQYPYARWAPTYPLVSCSPYPLLYLPPLHLQLPPTVIPTIIHYYTHPTDVFMIPSPSICILSQPSPPSFRFFNPIYCPFSASVPMSHHPTQCYIVFKAPHPVDGLFHTPLLPGPPYPHFRFFDAIYSSPFAHRTLPHHYTSIPRVFQSPWPSRHPILSPYLTLSPCLPFSLFLEQFMDDFCIHFYYTSSVYVHTLLVAMNSNCLTPFWGCNKLPGQRKCILDYLGNWHLKKHTNIHTYPLIHTQGMLYVTFSLGRPCGNLLQPAIDSRQWVHSYRWEAWSLIRRK